MKKLISTLILAAVLLASLTACGKEESPDVPSVSNTEKSSTTEAVDKTESTPNKPNPDKSYLAPNNYMVKGEDKFCKIEWHDDNSLIIADVADDGEIYSRYDIKLNEYGEAISINRKYTTEDENGKKIEEQSDYWLIPEYDSNHRLASVSYKDLETNEILSTSDYHYNDEGLRVKTTISGDEWESETLFEYKNGQLVKSTHKKFEPTGEDRIYTYKYDTNEDELITNTYCNISIPGTSEDDDWDQKQSFTYEKVTKVQYDFFYNTLIYHIIDSNEGIL